MAERGWPRHALRVGGFEFRRSVRAIRDDTARLVLLAASVLLPTLLLTGLAVLLAPAIRSATVTDLAMTDSVRGGATLFWLFGVFMLAQRAATAHSEPVAAPFVLTTVSPRTAVAGGAVAESLRVGTFALPPAVLAMSVAVYVFGSPAPLVLVPLVGALFVGSAVVVGRAAGYAAAWLVARVPFVARYRTPLSAAAGIAFFGLYAVFQFPGLPVTLEIAVLGSIPVGWPVDLLAVGTPVGWSPTHAASGVVTLVGIVLGGGWIAEQIAASLWFGDEVDPSDRGADATQASEHPSRGALARAIRPIQVPILTGPVRQVARWTLLRARREPQRLNFLMLPVFGGGSAFVSMLLQGTAPLSLLGPAVAVLSGWLAGAAFALNPFGDEGPVLPMTLTAVSGPTYVRGLIAPGVLATPAVAVLTLLAALVGGHGVLTALGLAAVGCLVAVVAATLAPLLGMWLPRYSAIRIGNSNEIRPPRLLAGVLHGVLVGVPGVALAGVIVAPAIVRLAVSGVGSVPGFLLALLAGDSRLLADLAATFAAVGASIRELPLLVVQVGVGGLLLVGGVVLVGAAYRQAVSRFERYEPY